MSWKTIIVKLNIHSKTDAPAMRPLLLDMNCRYLYGYNTDINLSMPIAVMNKDDVIYSHAMTYMASIFMTQSSFITSDVTFPSVRIIKTPAIHVKISDTDKWIENILML